MLQGIKYNIDKITNTENIVLARIANIPLLSPVTNAVIMYCKLCGIPQLNTANDVEELWWRITYLRSLGYAIFQPPPLEPEPQNNQSLQPETTNQNHKTLYQTHCAEPFFADVEAHVGLDVDVKYLARKQWMQQKIDVFIDCNSQLASHPQLKFASAQLLQQRPALIAAYIQQETKIDIQNLTQQPQVNTTPNNQTPAPENKTSNINPEAHNDPTKVEPLNPALQPEPPKNTPEWWAWKGMQHLLQQEALKKQESANNPTPPVTETPKTEPQSIANGGVKTEQIIPPIVNPVVIANELKPTIITFFPQPDIALHTAPVRDIVAADYAQTVHVKPPRRASPKSGKPRVKKIVPEVSEPDQFAKKLGKKFEKRKKK